ncbi:hypothetical protein BCF33_1054 [Hasllibacter halocynthiae]|uniref:Uncharacterized protein n=1 Tax=Hasllibacter halocynthiae TaxID=595589 RepID=A0A2T0X993_9RHOB|nr:hypothetical protein [Hasllibacter halocynthiae]PRY95434.1 hypothetical protein BCF33_1054 [Hasllibacter halocynthiae]
MRCASLLVLPLLMACADGPGAFAPVDGLPDDVLRYLPADATADDVRIREECLYVRTADGMVPVRRGRVEVYCNPRPPIELGQPVIVAPEA